MMIQAIKNMNLDDYSKENEMGFVNEYIPEEDYEKYDLRKICGDHNLNYRKGDMYSRSWTINRDLNAFLIQVWSHHEEEFSGWAFYWKGEWLFFELKVKEAVVDREKDSVWSLYQIRCFVIPIHLNTEKEKIISDMRSGFNEYAGGGVFCQRDHRSATLEFIKE